jgi:hypothetical protein
MKTTHCNLFFLTSLLSLPMVQAAVTLTPSDTFSASSGNNFGNLSITGDLSIYKGLDIGLTAYTALPVSAINIDWYNTALLPFTASFDLTNANAAFQWRDNLGGGAAVRNKMILNSQNVLSLYNTTGAAANITLNGNTGAINLTGTGSGISANGTPIFTLDSAGKVNFFNSGTFQSINLTPSTSPTTGALTLAGGLGVVGSAFIGSDSYINGVRVGRGTGNIQSNTALGAGSLNSNTSGWNNTALGASSLAKNTDGIWNTVIGGQSMTNNANSGGNVVVGALSFTSHTVGQNNIVLGCQAANFQSNGISPFTGGSDSIYIGSYSKGLNNSDLNSIVVGTGAVSEGSNTTVIGNATTTKTHLFGETVSDRLKVSGGSHLGATAENLLNLPVGVTGSYYGPMRTGSNFYHHDFTFTKMGDETSGDFTVPLGVFNNIGGDITVDISTSGSRPDIGSAKFVLSGKDFTYANDPLVASNSHAIGGAADVEVLGCSEFGWTHLFIKFNAKNDSPGGIAQRNVQVKVSGLASGANPQYRGPSSNALPIAKVDSTTRPNGGTTTKTITAAAIKLDGKVTIAQPQGDISMGIYQ